MDGWDVLIALIVVVMLPFTLLVWFLDAIGVSVFSFAIVVTLIVMWGSFTEKK